MFNSTNAVFIPSINLFPHIPESGGKLVEFSDVCRAYLGRWGEYTAIFFSLSALMGAMIVYWVLMSNFMYSSVSFIYGKGNPNKLIILSVKQDSTFHYLIVSQIVKSTQQKYKK